MAKVAGRNRTNRPYFFEAPDGKRVEFPAMAEGSGELDGAELDKFSACVKAGQIEAAEPSKPDPLDHDGNGRKGGSKKGHKAKKS